MRFIKFTFYFLLFTFYFEVNIIWANTASIQNDRKEIILNTPITIKTENGNLLLEDANGKLISTRNPPFFNIKVETGIDWKIYLPLLAALLTFFFSIYLAFINHKYIKNQKWYDKRSDKLLGLIEQINILVKGSLTDKANYSSYIIGIEISKIKIQMLSFFNKDSEVNKLLDSLMEKLKQDTPPENAIMLIIDQIIKLIVEEVKNG